MRRFLFAILLAVAGMTGVSAQLVVDSGDCGEKGSYVKWTLTDEGVLTISGKGKMKDFKSFGDSDVARWGHYYVKKLIIENGVTSIGDYAFYDCYQMTEATFPETLESIGKQAFAACSKLASINIPAGVLSISGEAFLGCSGLTSIKLPAGIKRIKYSTFENCTGLTSVELPARLTWIEWNAFKGCSGLTSITIPESVTHIEQEVFKGCSSLTSVTVPEGVEYFSAEVFAYCTSLVSVEWNVRNCYGFSGENDRPFKGCGAITTFTFGNAVENVPEYLCHYMELLTHITVPESVTSIGRDAFSDCHGLIYLTLPERLESIGDYVIDNCSRLSILTLYAPIPPLVSEYTFVNVRNAEYIELYVPEEAVETYKNTPYWKDFDIRPIDWAGVANPQLPAGVTVTTADGSILVRGAAGRQVSVYTMQGACIYSGRGDEVTIIAVPQGGVYVLRVDGNEIKVAVR